MPSFEIIGLLVLKKIFIIHGHGGHLGHVSQQKKTIMRQCNEAAEKTIMPQCNEAAEEKQLCHMQ